MEPLALAGDHYSIRALFELHELVDGAIAGYADIVLGCTIDKCPQLFLEEPGLSRSVSRLDSLLDNLGPDFVDDFERQKDEPMKRKAALTSVCSGSLEAVRSGCVQMLDYQISYRR